MEIYTSPANVKTPEERTSAKEMFERLGAAEKRVAIAKDVLVQLQKGRIIASSQGIPTDVSGKKLQSLVRCPVSVMEGMFLSALGMLNKTIPKIPKNGTNRMIMLYLCQYFDEDQVYAIMVASNPFVINPWNKLLGIKDESERLRVVMQNIIDNNGTFIR